MDSRSRIFWQSRTDHVTRNALGIPSKSSKFQARKANRKSQKEREKRKRQRYELVEYSQAYTQSVSYHAWRSLEGTI